MKKKLLTLLLSAALACSVFAGCGSDSSKESDKKTEASSDKKTQQILKRMPLKKKKLFSNQKLMKLIASLLTWITLL